MSVFLRGSSVMVSGFQPPPPPPPLLNLGCGANRGQKRIERTHDIQFCPVLIGRQHPSLSLSGSPSITHPLLEWWISPLGVRLIGASCCEMSFGIPPVSSFISDLVPRQCWLLVVCHVGSPLVEHLKPWTTNFAGSSACLLQKAA